MNYFNICINFLDMHNDFHSKNTNLHDVRIFSNLGAQFIIISGLVDSIINYKLCFISNDEPNFYCQSSSFKQDK